MKGGYSGSILYVDLARGVIRKEGLDPELTKSYIGGFGINNRMAYDLIKPGTEPLSPRNPIIIGAGPMVGACPGGTKIVGTTKLTTGFIRTAVGGGGAMLKWAGYDHVVIEGRAERPVYLKIFDDDVEICDAGELWGKDTYETADALWGKYGRECSSIVTGQAAEKLNVFALSFIDKQIGHFGKGGLAAVMGSKNLKAIVMRGTRGVKVAERKKFSKMLDDALHTIATWEDHETMVRLSEYARPKSFEDWNALLGGFPSQNGSTVYPRDKVKANFHEAWTNQLKRTSLACIGCPTSCKFQVEVTTGEDAGLAGYSRFVSAMLFASQHNLESWGQHLKCFDLLNRQGIDRWTASLLIAWAVELYEREIISRKDTGGLVLRHDYDTTIKLLEKIARREGLGDILAGSWKAATERFGKGSEKYAIQIKGMGPQLDPRHMTLGSALLSMAINPSVHNAPAASPTNRANSTLDMMKALCDQANIPAEARERIFTGPGGLNIARFTRHVEDWRRVNDSLGMCNTSGIMRMYPAGKLADVYTAVTGMEMSREEMLRAGERAYNLERAMNAREGFGRKDDAFPARWLEPVRAEGKEYPLRQYFDATPLTGEDVKKILDEYYEERRWDLETGNPTEAKLRELGLDFAVGG